MYRASSVLQVLLRSSAETKGHQYIRCPLDRCFITAEQCHSASNQTCTQEVTVLYEHDNSNKLVNLRFYFTISSEDHDGFIEESNESLQLLFRRGIINDTDIDRV